MCYELYDTKQTFNFNIIVPNILLLLSFSNICCISQLLFIISRDFTQELFLSYVSQLLYLVFFSQERFLSFKILSYYITTIVPFQVIFSRRGCSGSLPVLVVLNMLCVLCLADGGQRSLAE